MSKTSTNKTAEQRWIEAIGNAVKQAEERNEYERACGRRVIEIARALRGIDNSWNRYPMIKGVNKNAAFVEMNVGDHDFAVEMVDADTARVLLTQGEKSKEFEAEDTDAIRKWIEEAAKYEPAPAAKNIKHLKRENCWEEFLDRWDETFGALGFVVRRITTGALCGIAPGFTFDLIEQSTGQVELWLNSWAPEGDETVSFKALTPGGTENKVSFLAEVAKDWLDDRCENRTVVSAYDPANGKRQSRLATGREVARFIAAGNLNVPARSVSAILNNDADDAVFMAYTPKATRRGGDRGSCCFAAKYDPVERSVSWSCYTFDIPAGNPAPTTAEEMMDLANRQTEGRGYRYTVHNIGKREFADAAAEVFERLDPTTFVAETVLDPPLKRRTRGRKPVGRYHDPRRNGFLSLW